jgi:hypothetical protein
LLDNQAIQFGKRQAVQDHRAATFTQ